MGSGEAYNHDSNDAGEARHRRSHDAGEAFRSGPIGCGKEGRQDAGAPRWEVVY
jgi:hypothetical protein